MAASNLQEKSPDTFRVKTFLRPDMYELLTVFSYDQLRERREHLSFAHSTLLVPYNIRKYCGLFGVREYHGYLRSSNDSKRHLLTEVLRSTGISRAAAAALSEQRHRYVPPGRRPFAYLNSSTPVHGDTNISAPAVVGYMADATRHWASTLTVEIGIGTGLHAIAMARTHPRMTILGMERNEHVLAQLRENIAVAGMADRIRIVERGDERNALREAGQVYLTAAVSQRQLAELITLGGPNTDWLLPRQLSEWEFTSERENSWLITNFGSYHGYMSSGDWNSYCAIDAFRVDHDLRVESRSVMYDVTFVRFVE